jgi:cyanophycinase-like exopeptidase
MEFKADSQWGQVRFRWMDSRFHGHDRLGRWIETLRLTGDPRYQ